MVVAAAAVQGGSNNPLLKRQLPATETMLCIKGLLESPREVEKREPVVVPLLEDEANRGS